MSHKENLQKDLIKVSVCVITYNQERYIRECLESIVQQKADFKFEVIIRDDASSDGTYLILKEFAAKYPTLIKLLDGTKNLGMNKNALEVFRAAQGEYIAFCEGDDHWLEQQKIKKQVALLDQHQGIDLCCHPARIKKRERLMPNKQLGHYSKKIAIIPARELIKNDGTFIATPSLMIRRSVIDRLPQWFAQAPFGDYFLQVAGALPNGCIYMPDVMAVYRQNSVGSWSERMKNHQNKIAFIKLALPFLDTLSLELESVFMQEINILKAKIMLSLAMSYLTVYLNDDFKTAINASWELHPGYSQSQKLTYYLRQSPVLVRILYQSTRFFVAGFK